MLLSLNHLYLVANKCYGNTLTISFSLLASLTDYFVKAEPIFYANLMILFDYIYKYYISCPICMVAYLYQSAIVSNGILSLFQF